MVHKRLIVHLARELGKRFYGPNKNQYQNQSTGKIEILKVEKSLQKKSTDQKPFLKTGQSRHANGRVPIEVHPKGQFFA